MMSWWHYMAAVQSNLNKYACGLGTIQTNMPSDPFEIKEKSYLTDAPPSDMPTKMPTKTVKLYQPIMLHNQYNIHTVQRVVMSLQLQHMCLLA